jgi:DNA (cytosine-5)-methyltransferase 1
MTHGSLFSGIGGFDEAAKWMGWQNVFHCEWNPFGQRVLKYHFPESISYDDITKTDFSIHRGRIDVLSGGFPCQPYSTAGKRLGKEDSRHLWPEMLRAVREIQPRWVVGENVRGIISWSEGLVFDEVHSDLEAEGYSVRAFVLPAAGVGAPHRRDRVFFVSRRNAPDTNGKMLERRDRQGEAGWTAEQKIGAEPSDSAGTVEGYASNADIQRGKECDIPGITKKQIIANRISDAGFPNWKIFPAQSPVCGGDDGFSRELDLSLIHI